MKGQLLCMKASMYSFNISFPGSIIYLFSPPHKMASQSSSPRCSSFLQVTAFARSLTPYKQIPASRAAPLPVDFWVCAGCTVACDVLKQVDGALTSQWLQVAMDGSDKRVNFLSGSPGRWYHRKCWVSQSIPVLSCHFFLHQYYYQYYSHAYSNRHIGYGLSHFLSHLPCVSF